ncbi:YhjD/YihY/BrkB family envelope integrity protein [Streptomyces sp. NPDC056632]|uniref:YhjD/YihY/BrkB family envelope integrity protein n=1 Tax=unclassified Streptomyces TaxID=2593676 RepID=UPI0036CFEDED
MQRGTKPGGRRGGRGASRDRRRERRRRSGASLRNRALSLRNRALSLRAQAEERFPLITHLMSHLISVNVFDSATRLAAQTFLTAVPLLFVVGSVAPEGVREQFLSSLHAVFGLTGSAQTELDKALQGAGDPSEELRQTFGVVSGLMVLISATACSRAMQRLCERAWRLRGASPRVAAWRWIAWLAAWLVMIAVQGSLRDGFGLGLWLGLPLLLLAEVGMWWWSQHLLLAARVPWLPLLPGALLTGIALSVATATASLYMPRALDRSLEKYGSLGAVFTLLSWLIVLCVVVTLCVTAGAVIAREPWAARHLGTPEPPGPPSPPWTTAPAPPSDGTAPPSLSDGTAPAPPPDDTSSDGPGPAGPPAD